MARLRWSYEETAKVIEKAAQLRAVEDTLSKLDAIYRAQGLVISPTRQKTNIKTYLKSVLLRQLDDLEKKTPREQLAPPPTPAIEPPAPKEPTLTEMVKLCANLFAASFAEALAPLLAREMQTMRGTNGTNGHDALSQLQLEVPPPQRDFGKLPEKLQRHKVAIVGLNADQRREITKRFPSRDFRWIDNGAKGTTVAQVTRHCEASFVMIKFVRHVTDGAVKGEHHRVNGGVSDLARLVGARFPHANGQDHAAH
jgi:hypothetical protein